MNPQLDHYVGRKITRLLGDSESEDFTIVLDGNKQIHVNGPRPAKLDKGMELTEVMADGDERELRFCQVRGTQVIHFASVMTEQGSYTISDEVYPERRIDPSVTDEIMAARPPDPSPDRDKGASTSGDD